MLERSPSSGRAPARRIVAPVLTVLGVLSLFLHAPASAAPKLIVPKTEVEIGALLAGETAQAEFHIEDTGTDPHEITSVGTSCGCTTTNYPKTLAAGEKGALKAQLSSSALWNGRVEKEITLNSN